MCDTTIRRAKAGPGKSKLIVGQKTGREVARQSVMNNTKKAEKRPRCKGTVCGINVWSKR